MLSPTFIPELESFSDRINLNKVVAIPNPAPFPSDRSALQAKEKRLLFVGRLANQQKRVDRVLLIWKRIANDFPDWQLDILGDGPDRRQLENRSREMSLERIVFHGSQDPVPFYRRSQFLLLTSDFEGFGMVLVEAQAFGCIPIATNCFSAISDVIDDGRTGFITPVDNMDLFTRTLSLAISSPKKARIMGEAAVSHVAKFSSSRTAERWLSELKKVVGPTR